MRLFFKTSPAQAAQEAFAELTQRYGQAEGPAAADVIVSLGGDGEALSALQDGIRFKKPVFGLNFGHVGHLQNLHKENEDLIERIKAAESIVLSPLHVRAILTDGSIREAFAVNEVHICNQNRGRGIYLRVSIDEKERVPKLGADGLLIATTVGSTSYSKNAWGPILPLGDDMIAFTPNNAFMPDRMRACVIRPHPITVDVLEENYRPVDIIADSELVGRNARKIHINLDRNNAYELLFDPGYSLHEKVMRTQFPSAMPG